MSRAPSLRALLLASALAWPSAMLAETIPPAWPNEALVSDAPERPTQPSEQRRNAGHATDELTSLLRIAAQGTPPPVPIAERTVPNIEWPEPFAGVEDPPPLPPGAPLPILPEAAATPRNGSAERSRPTVRAVTQPVARQAASPAPTPRVSVSAVPRPNPARQAASSGGAPPAAAEPVAVVDVVAERPASNPPQTPSVFPAVESVTAAPTPPADGLPLDDALLAASIAAATTEDDGAEQNADPAAPFQFNGPSPAALARTLVRLQDDIARGSVAALSAQRVVLRRIAADFPTYPPAVWADRAQARALLIYALSGGNPRVVRAAFGRESLPSPFDELVRGALAYLEGRGPDARRALDPFDLTDVDVSLRGPLALAKAALVVEEDPAAADAFLARARDAAPATLVEEAALRRAALIAAERDDVEQFARLVNRYLRKFRSSVYAGNFRQRLAAAITRMRFIEEPAAFERLEAMLEPMTEAGRRELYLLLSRAAVEFGREDAGRNAAERALAVSEPGTMDHRRARLYRAAADGVHPERVEGAIDALRALEDEGGLDPQDVLLLDAALTLSQSVERLPASEDTPVLAALDVAEPAATSAEVEPTDDPFRIDEAAAARVDAALAAVDALLETRP